MTTSYPQTIIYVDNDREDNFLATEIPVIVDYIITVDSDYGADADGKRGTILVEYDILDIWIEADILRCISAELAEWALENARIIFHSRRKHF